MTHQRALNAHYGSRDPTGALQAVLEVAGLGKGPITPDILAALDQFHVGGAAATAHLIARLPIKAGDRVLDVGAGLGGPARALALACACHVTGIDLNQPFVDAANDLSNRMGLADRVVCVQGDALDLPFGAAEFDAVITQHVVMNIADRAALYAGVFRVLRRGGVFAMFDVVAGPAEAAPDFPLPWASDPAASHLLTAPSTQAALRDKGFSIDTWDDMTEQAINWNMAQIAAAQNRPPALQLLALPLVMGPDFPAMVGNLRRGIAEGKLRLLQTIVPKPV